MDLFYSRYNSEPKKTIEKNEPPKQGAALFFSTLWREFGELCKLNFVLMLLCAPVVTAPAAITAMSRVMIYMFMDEPIYTFSVFFDAFRDEWKRATIMGVIYFPTLAALVFGQYFYSAVMENFPLSVISMFACVVTVIAGFYIFPMIAAVNIGITGILKNAVILTFIRIPQNIAALMAVALLTLAVILLLPYSAIVVIVIYFALIGFITVFCAYTGIKKFVISN